MLKKLFLFLCILAMPVCIQPVSAQSPLPLKIGRVDPTEPGHNHPKSPVLAPTVYIDGYELTFDTPCDGCTLQLVDEDNDVVYSIVIPVGTTTLYLPSDLEGTFELQIISGDWLFYGEIEL